jgi:hypothetical protein
MYSWEPSIGEFIPLQNGAVEISIDGAIMYHTINIYRKEVEGIWSLHNLKVLERAERIKKCCFTFGQLTWESKVGGLHAHFIPGDVTEITTKKQQFGRIGLKMNHKALIPSYFNALELGVSDPRYLWLRETQALPERMEKTFNLLLHVKITKELLLLTYGWLENASRIRRRALSQSGEDCAFLENIERPSRARRS